MIINTIELRSAIRCLQRQARQPNPSRILLASALEKLAEEVWAAPRKKAPKKLPPQEVKNIGKIEQDGLKSLSDHIGYAIHSIDSELHQISDRARSYITDDEYSEKEALKKAVELGVDVSEVISDLERGVRALGQALSKTESATGEKDLTEVVEQFEESLNKVRLDWVEAVGALESARTSLVKAQDFVPKALTGPGALGNLQKCFDLIGKAIDTILRDGPTVPKVPRALDPEDPRQLGFGFTASTIKNAADLCSALDLVYHMASCSSPSRQILADQLLRVANALSTC